MNGVLVATTSTVPASIQLRTETDFQIGHNASDSGSHSLRAAVDVIQVYKKALFPEQVEFLFNNPGQSTPWRSALSSLQQEYNEYETIKSWNDNRSLFGTIEWLALPRRKGLESDRIHGEYIWCLKR